MSLQEKHHTVLLLNFSRLKTKNQPKSYTTPKDISEESLSVKLAQKEPITIQNKVTPLGVEQGRRSVINAVADDSENSGDVEVDNINDHLARNLLKYKGATPSSRPKIPRMTQSKEMMGNVETINNLIREQMGDVSTLDDLVHLVYAGLVTVCEIHGTLPTVEREEREGNTAPWKVRLEGKIVKMRKNSYHTYLPQCCCTIQETEEVCPSSGI
ncbi:hypothetical protein HHI36_024091 [Cryptolaemus montrouzieri]|uniref:Uncharacterized protein n=1 Tax=Cryptolaemus montrouzieri TaxID=559131 RepID=A0ABD2N1Z8_9CUCU